jgi:hypothetical protein
MTLIENVFLMRKTTGDFIAAKVILYNQIEKFRETNLSTEDGNQFFFEKYLN